MTINDTRGLSAGAGARFGGGTLAMLLLGYPDDHKLESLDRSCGRLIQLYRIDCKAMTPINEEVAIKLEILEISLSSLSGSSPSVKAGNSGKKREREGPEKNAAAANAPKKVTRLPPNRRFVQHFYPISLLIIPTKLRLN